MSQWLIHFAKLTFQFLPDVNLLCRLVWLEVVQMKLVDLQPEVGRLVHAHHRHGTYRNRRKSHSSRVDQKSVFNRSKSSKHQRWWWWCLQRENVKCEMKELKINRTRHACIGRRDKCWLFLLAKVSKTSFFSFLLSLFVNKTEWMF